MNWLYILLTLNLALGACLKEDPIQDRLFSSASIEHTISENIPQAVALLDKLHDRFTADGKTMPEFIESLKVRDKTLGPPLADLYESFNMPQDALGQRALSLLQEGKKTECFRTLVVLWNRYQKYGNKKIHDFLETIRQLSPNLESFYLDGFGQSNRAERLTAMHFQNLRRVLDIEIWASEILSLYKAVRNTPDLAYTTLLPLSPAKVFLGIPLLLCLAKLPNNEKEKGTRFVMEWFPHNLSGKLSKLAISQALETLAKTGESDVFIDSIISPPHTKQGVKNLAYLKSFVKKTGASFIKKS